MRRTGSRNRFISLILYLLPILGCGTQENAPIQAGGRDVASLVEELHHRDPHVRRQAVLKLGNIGDADPAVAPALAGALGDRDPLVRRDAIFAAVKLKSPPQEILDQLASIREHDPKLHDFAARALAKMNRNP